MPTCPVRFAFATAEDAAAECRRHAAYLDGLAEARASAATVAVEEWRGRFRDDFDRELASTQQALRDQADALRSWAGRIDDAAAAASTARTTCQRDHDHTPSTTGSPTGSGPR